ncbi:MAG: hypothetical protein OCC49_16170 [Fibrobacterales bacterium]
MISLFHCGLFFENENQTTTPIIDWEHLEPSNFSTEVLLRPIFKIQFMSKTTIVLTLTITYEDGLIEPLLDTIVPSYERYAEDTLAFIIPQSYAGTSAYITTTLKDSTNESIKNVRIDTVTIQDSQKIFFVDNRDSQKYPYVKIGKQSWMAKNLNYESTFGSSCYDGVPTNCDYYGRLYSWTTATGLSLEDSSITHPLQGICPEGWHLPSISEWDTLFETVANEIDHDYTLKDSYGDWSGHVTQKLLAAGIWRNSPYITDNYGFSILPSGSLFNKYLTIGWRTTFWTADRLPDETYHSEPQRDEILFFSHSIKTSNSYAMCQNSIRCIKSQ